VFVCVCQRESVCMGDGRDERTSSAKRQKRYSIRDMRMYVCACVYVYVYAYVCMYVHVCMCMCMCMRMCEGVCMYVSGRLPSGITLIGAWLATPLLDGERSKKPILWAWFIRAASTLYWEPLVMTELKSMP
jgi:hypothetical protein